MGDPGEAYISQTAQVEVDELRATMLKAAAHLDGLLAFYGAEAYRTNSDEVAQNRDELAALIKSLRDRAKRLDDPIMTIGMSVLLRESFELWLAERNFVLRDLPGGHGVLIVVPAPDHPLMERPT